VAKRQRKRKIELEYLILGIDSSWEPVTKAGSEYRTKHVYGYFTKKRLQWKRLSGSMARRQYVAPDARQGSVDFVTGVGHGSFSTYTGDFGDEVWSVGNYGDDEVRGKVFHLLSCQTARDLGPDMVKRGARAYFGYDVNFTLLMEYSDIFFECDSEIDRAFADGLNAGEVFGRVTALFDRRIEEFRAQGREYAATLLETDRDHLCGPSKDARWGDTEARLEE
jgi:hypothetical protein